MIPKETAVNDISFREIAKLYSLKKLMDDIKKTDCNHKQLYQLYKISRTVNTKRNNSYTFSKGTAQPSPSSSHGITLSLS